MKYVWALVLLFVFSIPFEKSVQIPDAGTATRLVGIAAFAAAFGFVLLRRQFRGLNLPLIFGAAFVAWAGLTWFWSFAPATTAARIATFVQLLAMAWMLWQLCRTQERQRSLLWAYVAGSVVASGATIARYVQGEQTYYRRYAAAGFDPNDLGLTVALAIPLALHLSGTVRPALPRASLAPKLKATAPRWFAWAAIALAEAAVLLSGSRTALIAILVGFAYAVFDWRKSDRGQKAAVIALLGFLLLGLVRLAPAASRQRLATLPGELARGTLHNRTRIWKTGLKALKQHPLIGVGAGAYPEAVRPWLGRPGIPGHEYVAHNTFLSVLVENGLIGATLFGLMLVSVAVFAWMLPARERALWLVMLGVWAAGVATLTWEHRKPSWLLFALVMTAWARAFREDGA